MLPLTYLFIGSALSAEFSPHAHHMAQALGSDLTHQRAIPTPAGERLTSYGFLPYWISDPLSLDLDSLTHVAYFRVGLSSTGVPTETSGWTNIASDLVAAAHAVGTKVHLTVAVFDDDTQNSVLGSATHRTNAVTALARLVNDFGADGVNVDFEGTPASQKANLVSFVAELKAEVDEVYVDTPAIDWSGAYDYDELAFASDGLFIMAYDYHWGGGSPGPVSPLFGGSPWPSDYAMDWTLDDYRTYGAPDDKIVIGLPLYGREWPSPSDAVPGTSSGDAVSHTMANAIERAAGYPARFEETSQTAWAFTEVGQLWYDDHATIETKLEWSVDQGVQGVGFWALGYDGNDPDFWAMVDSYTVITTTEDSGAPDTGDPDTGSDEPPPPDTGRLDDTSEPPVLSEDSQDDAEEKGSGCGCSSTKTGAEAWLLLPLMGLLRRRRRA